MRWELIEDPDDSRLDGYRALRDPRRRRQVDRDSQVFVAEGLRVLEALLRSPYRLRSVLSSTARAAAAAALLEGSGAPATPLYVVSPALLDGVAGFPFHRGVVALGERRTLPDPWELLVRSRLVVVAEGLNDHENLGALYRNAAAFGVDAVLLDPSTADPLYRRSLRVSMGHALRVPTGRLEAWPGSLRRLADAGWVLLALTPDPSAADLDEVTATLAARAPAGDRAAGRAGGPPGRDGPPPGARVALLVGSEGTGLSRAALGAGGTPVRIPMAGGVDSLNVATAAAVALHSLTRGRAVP